jgi:hypothetical protein
MRADLYARPRQKDMRLIFRAPVVKVDLIRIFVRMVDPSVPHKLMIWINGEALGLDEKELLARADGFPNGLAEMHYFWLEEHGPGAFYGQIIHWDYERRTASDEATRSRASATPHQDSPGPQARQAQERSPEHGL